MADVNISKYRASVVRDGSKPASPGFVVSEGQSPTDPAGTGQNHLPVTIAAASTALSITESQILSGAGTVGQYIRGDGSLADFPSASGGGSSVSYYLNGSVNQGTIGGVAYRELSKVPILGAGTDFTINADGYIASFITDAGDPNLLEIPGGNWNFETYFSASSGGGTPTFYVELYKYDGTTFTLIASNSSAPEFIAFGTTLTAYFSTLAVPTTTLALTDRLAVRYYVTHSGRTITLHTENNHLCQIITTFTTGLTALNGLTAQVQNFAVGTSGTDFNIASATATHTFNLPTASATNRGALSSADWTTFNNKQNALGYVPVPETRTLTINGTAFDLSANRSWIVGDVRTDGSYSNPSWITALAWSKITGTPTTLSGYGITDAVPSTRTITINGTTQDLSANRTFNVGTVTSVGLSSATSGVTIGSTPVTTSGTITLAIATASGSQNGLLSSTDWTTFNNKQNALTNPVTGTGTTNYLPKFTGASTIGNSQVFDNGTQVGIGTASPDSKLTVNGQVRVSDLTLQGFYQARTSDTAGAGVFGGNSFVLRNGATSEDLNFDVFNRSTFVWYTPVTIKNTGNLLVGTTTDNGARLQVSGVSTFSSRLLVGTSSGVGQDFVSVRFSSADTFSQGLNMVDSNASANSGTFQVFRRSDDTYLGNIRRNGTDNAIYVGGNSYLALGANNTEFVRITSSGNVGIGTSSPTNRLHLGAGVNQTIKVNSATANAAYFGIFQDAAGISVNRDLATGTFQDSGKSSAAIYIRGEANNGFIVFETSTINNGNSTEAMRITSSANLLVGTTTDNGARLQVSGQGFFTHPDTPIRLNNSGGTFTQLDFLNNGTQKGAIWWNNSSNTLNLWTGVTTMTLTSSGNVGIGTTSPAARLEVRGATAQLLISQDATQQMYLGVDSNYAEIQAIRSGIAFDKPLILQRQGGNVLIGSTTDNGSKLQVNGTIRTANPTGSTSDGWLLGRALVSGSSTPDRWIRVQIGNLYYDILARYIGSV